MAGGPRSQPFPGSAGRAFSAAGGGLSSFPASEASAAARETPREPSGSPATSATSSPSTLPVGPPRGGGGLSQRQPHLQSRRMPSNDVVFKTVGETVTGRRGWGCHHAICPSRGSLQADAFLTGILGHGPRGLAEQDRLFELGLTRRFHVLLVPRRSRAASAAAVTSPPISSNCSAWIRTILSTASRTSGGPF